MTAGSPLSHGRLPRKHLFPVLSKGARRIGHFLLLHPLAHRPRRKIRFNCGERKEEAPGQLDRHNPHKLAHTTRGVRGASAYFTHSTALTVLRCAYTWLPQETTDPGGLPRTCSLSYPSTHTVQLVSELMPSWTKDAPLSGHPEVLKTAVTLQPTKPSPKAQLLKCFPSTSGQRMSPGRKKGLKKPDNITL